MDIIVSNAPATEVSVNGQPPLELTVSNAPSVDVSLGASPTINVLMETKVIGDRVQVDSQLSETSENAIQNKAVTEALGDKQDVLVSGENIKTINGQSLLGKGNIVIKGGEGGGAGLQYAVERTVHVNKEILEEGDIAEIEITDEQRAYNLDTYNMCVNGEPVILSAQRSLMEMWYGSKSGGYFTFGTLGLFEDILIELTITVDNYGNATARQGYRELTGGGNEIPSDMSSDFSNDF